MDKRERNPMVHLANSINRSMVGDLNGLASSGCFTKIITLIILFAGLFIYARCSN